MSPLVTKIKAADAPVGCLAPISDYSVYVLSILPNDAAVFERDPVIPMITSLPVVCIGPYDIHG